MIGLLNFSFELIFELIIENDQDLKDKNIKGLRFIKDNHDALFCCENVNIYI